MKFSALNRSGCFILCKLKVLRTEKIAKPKGISNTDSKEVKHLGFYDNIIKHVYFLNYNN